MTALTSTSFINGHSRNSPYEGLPILKSSYNHLAIQESRRIVLATEIDAETDALTMGYPITLSFLLCLVLRLINTLNFKFIISLYQCAAFYF